MRRVLCGYEGRLFSILWIPFLIPHWNGIASIGSIAWCYCALGDPKGRRAPGRVP